MRWGSEENIKRILYRMVSCSSVSGTKDEIKMANVIYDIFNEIPYFKENHQHLSLNKIEHDKLERYFVTALVKGHGNKTIVLINHMDTVDYNGYGPYKHLALNPEELTKTLDQENLPKDAKEDLLSGDWIFGRGINDMKCGGALEIDLLGEVSQHIENFKGNLLFLSVPDEENNSAGIIGAIPILNRLKEEYNLDYVALINTEPHPVKDGKHDLHIGSMGKVLPLFYCEGKETHAGQLLEGLNADLMIAEVQKQMELNMDLVDRVDGEYTYPPTALKIGDTKELYNVSTPVAAYAYYNVLTLKFTPGEIMNILKDIGYKAFENVLDQFRSTVKAYKELTGEEFPCPWEPKVMTYDEIYKYNKKHIGNTFVDHMENFIELNKGNAGDEREFAIKIIAEVARLCPDPDPKIIIAYAPPYYPHVRNKGETDEEKGMLRCVDRLVEYSRQNFGVDWRINKFYKQLSDMSYCGVQDGDDVLKALKPNMPNLGHTYFLPLDEMAKFNVPVLNIGPWGKDLHKFSARLNGPFAFNIAPKILRFAVEDLLKN